MAPQIRSQDEVSRESLQRGARLLLHLQRAARAARLEEHVVQLQSLLSEARNGDEQPLQRWLEAYDHYGDQNEVYALREDRRETWVEQPTQAVGGPVEGWSELLQHARRRMSNRALHHAPHEPPQGRSAEAAGEALAVVEGLEVEAFAREELPTNELDIHSSGEHAVVIDEYAADWADKEKVVVEELDAQVLADLEMGSSKVDGQSARPLSRPLMSGMSTSLLGHGLLLVVLFMTTYRPPVDAASLGAQMVSVSAPTEELELSSPVEWSEPPELQQLDAAADTSSVALPPQTAALTEIGAPVLQSSPVQGLASRAPPSSTVLSGSGTGVQGSPGGAAALSKVGGKFFGVGAGGNFFAYVVDSSGSMRGAAWESAKDELVRSLRTLSDRQRFTIVFFAKEMSAIPEPGMREPALYGLNATQENIEHARRWIDTIKLDRGGPPNDALAWAIERDPDAIYLLTDGVTKTDVCGFLRESNRLVDIINGEQVRVPIHAIAYHSLDGQQLLRQLAQENGGQFHYVPSRDTK